jgi:putative transposase
VAATHRPEQEALIVRFARENSGWGYDRIVGALANLGHLVSDQTVGIATHYVLFFIHLESRRLSLAGLTRHPTAEWMIQMARNAAVEGSGCLRCLRYLLPDRDTKFCAAFLDVLRSGGIRPLALPPSSPNRNAFAERWVSSVPQECLSKLILFGEASLRRALNESIEHHHFERNRGNGNLLLFPSPNVPLSPKSRTVHCRDRLSGLLKFYSRVA